MSTSNNNFFDPIKLSQDAEKFFADRGITQWIICTIENKDDHTKCGLLGSENSPGIKGLLNDFQAAVINAGGNIKQSLLIKKNLS